MRNLACRSEKAPNMRSADLANSRAGENDFADRLLQSPRRGPLLNVRKVRRLTEPCPFPGAAASRGVGKERRAARAVRAKPVTDVCREREGSAYRLPSTFLFRPHRKITRRIFQVCHGTDVNT